MSFDVERVKSIDDKTKKLVSGYIHETEKKLSTFTKDNPFYIIPDRISFFFVFVYYFMN